MNIILLYIFEEKIKKYFDLMDLAWYIYGDVVSFFKSWFVKKKRFKRTELKEF